ncbi:MAG: PepSY-associated TM helix domain-containing protein [Acetobacter papayae]
MKKSFRASMGWLHDWAGLITGWVLFIMVLAGGLSVFRSEITCWMHPELRAEAINPALSTQAAVDWLEHNAPDAPAWYLNVASARMPATQAIWWQQDESNMRLLDGRTGQPLARETMGGDFFYNLHFELMLPFPWGRLIAAIAAVALVLILLTGIMTHKRIFADFFTFRPGKGQRSWLDVHNLAGVAALPFHLMIALSGAVLLSTMLLPGSISAVYGAQAMDLGDDLTPAMSAPPPAGHKAALAPLTPMLEEALRRMRGDGIGQVYLYNPTDAASVVVVTGGNARRIGLDTHVLRFEGTTGRILADYYENRPVVVAFGVLYGLHDARFAPGVTRWFYFGSSVLLALVIASGLRMWVTRRLRQGGGAGVECVARLNVGMTYGVPVALAGFMLANRVLPVGMAGRAGAEQLVVLVVWLLLLGVALVLPRIVAARLLLVCLLAVMLTLVGLSAPWRGGVAQGVALVCLAAAVACALALWRGRSGQAEGARPSAARRLSASKGG